MTTEQVSTLQPNTKAKAFMQSGDDAAASSNFEYAVQMYREACKIQPDYVPFRQRLRAVQRKKYGDDPAKVGFLDKSRTQTIRLRAKVPKAKGQWSQVLNICEDAFAVNPWDVGVSRDASEAAVELGYNALALWLLETVAPQVNDADFFEHMAHAYELNNEYHKAIECWERVKKLNPRNESTVRMINALAAKATIKRSGLSEAINKHKEEEATKVVDLAAEMEDLKAAKLAPEERLLKNIQEQPNLVGFYLELSDIYRGRSQLDEAHKILARGLKAVPNDPALHSVYADVQILRLQHARDQWIKHCQERPDDDVAKSKLDQLIVKLNEYEVKEYKRRAALRPEDLKLQYELGLRLSRAGQHRDAIGAFQQARNDPNLKVQALHQAGLSFEADGVLKLAERHYQDALKAAETNDLPTINALHYRLGRVAEAQGDVPTAIEHYHEVAANDYGYLNVAERLRNLS